MRIRMFAVATVAAFTLMLATSQTSQAQYRHGCDPIFVAPGYGGGYSTYRPAAYGPYYGQHSIVQPYSIGYAPAYGSGFSVGFSRPGFSLSYSTGYPGYGRSSYYSGNRGHDRGHDHHHHHQRHR